MTGDGLSVRPTRDGDFPACLTLLRVLHDHDRYPLIWPPDPAGWVVGHDALAAMVAERAGVVIGQVLLRRAVGAPVSAWEAGTNLPAARLGVISRLFVHPAHRRAGAGRLLLATATADASTWPMPGA